LTLLTLALSLPGSVRAETMTPTAAGTLSLAAVVKPHLVPQLQLALMAVPPQLSLGAPRDEPNGFLVARLAFGIYFGKALPPRSQLFDHVGRELRRPIDEKSNSKLPGTKLSLQATCYFSPLLGLNLETRVGRGWYTGLSLVYRW
jgi:hypothetical protein